MSVWWDWYRKYKNEANKSNDPLRQMLYIIYESAHPMMSSDPDAALALFRQGRALAENMGEKWWGAFYDQWLIQTLQYRKRDFPAALDLAVKTAVEVRKVDYDQFPMRTCVDAHLVDTQVDIDPHGYSNSIEQALDYLRTQANTDPGCRCCLQGIKYDFSYKTETYSEADSMAAQYIVFAEDARSAHWRVNARCAMCELSFCRGDWDELLGLARDGQQIAVGKLPDSFWVVELFIWEALALRHLKREDEAKRAYQNGISRASRLKSLPGTGYYDALCAYHEAGGDLSAALVLREQQLRNGVASGSPYYENLAQVKRCELLAQMGTLTEADLLAARTAANKLKDPSRVLTELERFTPNS